MKDLIILLLDKCFYYSVDDCCIFSRDNSQQPIGYNTLESFIRITFNLDKDYSYALVFNWLLDNGVKLVRENWNKSYISHNISYGGHYEQNSTEDIDFKYVMIDE